MDELNPLGKPIGPLSTGPLERQPALSALRAFSIVIASALGFGGAGMMIGYGLGVATPGYYRGVFANGNEPGFDPVEVGLGLGLSQGLLSGIVVGIVVVLAVSLARWRRSDSKG